MTDKPQGAGKSSIDLVDLDVLFERLLVREDMTLLDLGCGEGNYTLAAAERLGNGAEIIGIDLWEGGVETLEQRAAGFDSVRGVQADAGGPFPLEDQSVDGVLMATVFHDLVHGGKHEGALKEITRVLRPKGVLAIVEFKVMDGPPGPPARIRIGPDKLSGMLAPYGFVSAGQVDTGEHTYLSIFNVE